jgi:magnesium transporter
LTLEQRLVSAYVESHPLEAARAMETMPTRELAEVLADAGDDAAPALRFMAPGPLAAVLSYMGGSEAGHLLSLMPLDDQMSVLPLIKPEPRDAMLRTLDEKDANLLSRLLSYPKQSAASLAEFDTFRITSDVDAGDALERSRRAEIPVRYYVYVIDRDNHLVGVVSLKQLMRAAPDTAVSEFMHRHPAHVAATDAPAEIAANHHWLHFPMLPVVDADGRLVGVILYETIQRLREERAYDPGWNDTRETLIGLSEVYWLGLSTILGSPPDGRDER